MPFTLERWLAGRWIAGPAPDDALWRAAQINGKGIGVMINYLGEDLPRKADVDEAVSVYLDLISKMADKKINGAISIKPTQIGLSINYGLMQSNYEKIMQSAREKGIFVWLDMEEPEHVTDTIKMYLESGTGQEGRAGICIQAYLKRSLDDVKSIVKSSGIVRLVKGAYGYKEGNGIIDWRNGISLNYREIMVYLFENSTRFMIATHDMQIVSEARELNKKWRRNVTYAMLNGIRNGSAMELASSGENVALYVPFGTRWVGYSYRRMKEGGHARLILASLFRSQEL